MRRSSLFRELALPVISASVLGILLTAFLANGIARREILRGVDREINLSAGEIESQLASFFAQRSADLESFAEVPLILDYFNNVDFGLSEEAGAYRTALRDFSSVFINRTGVHLAAGLLDRAGRQVYRVAKDDSPSDAAASAALFARAKASGRGGRYVSAVMDRPGRAHYMAYAKPVHNAAGEFRGVTWLEADLSSIEKKLETLRVGASGFSFVSDGTGGTVLGGRAPAGASALSVTRGIADTGLTVTVVALPADFLAPLAQLRLATIGLAIFFGIISALFIFWRIRRSLSPIGALVGASERFSAGDLDSRVEVAEASEFAVLARAFNDMAAAVRLRSLQLHAHIRQLYSLQKMSSSILKKLDAEEICRLCLEASVTGLGFERGLLYWVNGRAGTITGKYAYGVISPGFTEAEFRKRSIALGSGDILAETAALGKPLNMTAPASDPRCNPTFLRETDSRAFCLVPILGSGKVYGIVAVDNRRSGRPITDEDMNNLSTFCNATGLALHNAELIENLTESRARYITTINGTADAIAGLSGGLRVVICNRSAERIFGMPAAQLADREFLSLFPKEAGLTLRAELDRAGFVKDFPVCGRHAGTGEETRLSVTLTPIEREAHGREWSAVVRDVTDQARLQAHLIQTEKLSAVGQLISGIAHELNNPLTTVVGYAELLGRAAFTPESMRADLAYILKNAERCHAIVNSLLNFVRQRPTRKTGCGINEVVEATLELMHYKLEKTENISVRRDLAPDLPPVEMDAQRMGQVFVNLISNACDALGSVPGRREIAITSEFRDGRVLITVKDNGRGIRERDLAQVFQPFFTTKPEGKGTGLGLVICRSIIEEHGGTMKLLYSRPGQGTAFEVSLPQAPTTAVSARECFPADLPPVSGKKVLIIDDEEDVLPIMYRLIKEDGDFPETAVGAAEGLRKLRSGAYDLVISDVEMGAVNGRDIYAAAAAMDKPPLFLFVTGDVLNPALLEWVERYKLPCLAKPFKLAEFSAAVRKLLYSSEKQA